MRIAFNATALLSPLTGVGQYTFHLTQQLARNPAHDVRFFYAVGFSPEVRTAPVPQAGRVLPLVRQYLPMSYELSRFVQGVRFRRGTRQTRFDLYHEPNFLSFPFDGPTVVTVHDLSWIRFPEAHPEKRVRALNRYFEPSLRRASIVLTDSEFVRQEVIDVFGVPPERIVAIPLGVNAQFHPRQPAETAEARLPQGLEHGRYFLAVGTLEPRKNLIAAVRAHAMLPPGLQQRFPLVLAGGRGWHNQSLDRELAPGLASGAIRATGYLSGPALACLTAGATASVYPSVYEGFGLPPLEAMASGVVAITSDCASLPEVVGGAGLLVDPRDVPGLSRAMQETVESPGLREKLCALGLARAEGFTWERCASETVAAYHLALRA